MRSVDDLPAFCLPPPPEKRVESWKQSPLHVQHCRFARGELAIQPHQIEWIPGSLQPSAHNARQVTRHPRHTRKKKMPDGKTWRDRNGFEKVWRGDPLHVPP